MAGYHGRYLRIDPRAGRSGCIALSERTLREFIGGVGLGTWILANEAPAGVDPLGPDAPLVFALSPLVGSPLTTSAKFAVVAIGPLTGRLCDALCSSHFAIAAKRAGVDAIALAGAFEEPTVVFVDGLGRDEPLVDCRPAGDLWGLSAAEAEARIRAEHGPAWQVAAIGPAGERLIPFATISHDGRHAGRGGLGAVMGSKRIKALAVRGDRRTPLADPRRTVELARDLSRRSFGPATEKYRELGTVANLLTFNRFDALPTRNFQSGHFEGADRLAGHDLGPSPVVAKKSCASCTIGCEHIYAVGKSGGARMEYESLFALGPLCGVDDPEAVLRAAVACDAAGLDTISTGGTIAFFMECVQRGWIDGRLPGSGRVLSFGDGQAVTGAIAALLDREGIGEWLALGSRRAAERIGHEAPDLAPHVKGLELPGYDPRALHTMALGLAVGTRGADHNRSGAYEADFSGKVDRRDGGEDSALAAIETEDRAALIDSLILCKFLRGVFGDLYAESAELLRAVTGWDIDAEELRKAAKRVVNARKCLNLREGWTRVEDTLPARFLDERPAPDAPSLSRSRLDLMIGSYYRGRTWDAAGRVPESLRRELGIAGTEFGPAMVSGVESVYTRE
ncbi:aldehyde ferredoxin oxidoreductase family protein [Tundrisphaera lichenicola]|uniref:aldehyde ferredoxin oxidoreductase family protein n=1 Tax=Tundrisphaera lichenicola TaxID=2029860 RepID=UPI003EB6F1E9